MKLVKIISLSMAVSVVGVVAGTLIFHFVLAAAFVEPTKEPPLGNVPGPIWNTASRQANSNFNISGDGVIGRDLTVNNNITTGYATIKKKLTANEEICLGGVCKTAWPEGGAGSQTLQQVTDLGNITTRPMHIDTDGGEAVTSSLTVGGNPSEFSAGAGVAAKGSLAGGYFQSISTDASGNPLGQAVLGTPGIGVNATGRGSSGVGVYGTSSNIAGYFRNGTNYAFLGYGGYAAYFYGTTFSYGDFIVNKTNKIKSQGNITLQLDYDQAVSNDLGAKFKITDAAGAEKFSVDETGTLGIYGALAIKDLIIEPKDILGDPYLLIGLTADTAGSERILKLRHRREVFDSPITNMKASLDLDGDLMAGGVINAGGGINVSGQDLVINGQGLEINNGNLEVYGGDAGVATYLVGETAYNDYQTHQTQGPLAQNYFLVDSCFVKTYDCGGGGCDSAAVKKLGQICTEYFEGFTLKNDYRYTAISASCEDLKESVGIIKTSGLGSEKPYWCVDNTGIDLTVTCCKRTSE